MLRLHAVLLFAFFLAACSKTPAGSSTATASSGGGATTSAASSTSGTSGSTGSTGTSTSAAGTTSTSAASTTGASAGCTPTTGGSSGAGGTSGVPSQGGDGGACGYLGGGVGLHVADGIDLCMPPAVCTAETCPPDYGTCVNGKCQFKPGYGGVTTLHEAWVTQYCTLSTGGCHGVTQTEFPEVTAGKIASATGMPLCENAQDPTANCVGIAASSPMVVGNSQEAKDPATGKLVAQWGLGMTEASGLCYQLTGPGGTVLVALTDRCGGYCKCGAQTAFDECGPCVNAGDMQTNCPCVGEVPPVYTNCCGNGCGVPVVGRCDWCASNNHPHFDLDIPSFNHICGNLAGNGSCRLTQVKPVPCLAGVKWPPSGSSTSCGTDSYQCAAPMPHSQQPSDGCCCNYNECPQCDGSCAARPASCGAGSCACGTGQPDATHQAANAGCCCLDGLTPQPDGSCQ